MPSYTVTVGTREYTVDAPDPRTAWAWAHRYADENPPAPPKTGYIDSGIAAVKGALSRGQTGIESLFTDPNVATERGMARGQRLGDEYQSQVSLDEIKRRFSEDGLFSAAGEVARQFPYALAEQAPRIAATMAAAKTGAMAGAAAAPLLGPAAPFAPLIGGLAGAVLPSGVEFFGGNLERQGEAQRKAGQEIGVDRGAAALAAVPQAGLDVVSTLLPLGRTYVGSLLGPRAASILSKGGPAADEALWKTISKGGALSLGVEVPTEVIQQVLERKQAGLPLTDDEAMAEYGQAAYGAALLSPIGAAGRYRDRSQARETRAEEAQAKALADRRAAEESTRTAALGEQQRAFAEQTGAPLLAGALPEGDEAVVTGPQMATVQQREAEIAAQAERAKAEAPEIARQYRLMRDQRDVLNEQMMTAAAAGDVDTVNKIRPQLAQMAQGVKEAERRAAESGISFAQFDVVLGEERAAEIAAEEKRLLRQLKSAGDEGDDAKVGKAADRLAALRQEKASLQQPDAAAPAEQQGGQMGLFGEENLARIDAADQQQQQRMAEAEATVRRPPPGLTREAEGSRDLSEITADIATQPGDIRTLRTLGIPQEQRGAYEEAIDNGNITPLVRKYLGVRNAEELDAEIKLLNALPRREEIALTGPDGRLTPEALRTLQRDVRLDQLRLLRENMQPARDTQLVEQLVGKADEGVQARAGRTAVVVAAAPDLTPEQRQARIVALQKEQDAALTTLQDAIDKAVDTSWGARNAELTKRAEEITRNLAAIDRKKNPEAYGQTAADLREIQGELRRNDIAAGSLIAKSDRNLAQRRMEAARDAYLTALGQQRAEERALVNKPGLSDQDLMASLPVKSVLDEMIQRSLALPRQAVIDPLGVEEKQVADTRLTNRPKQAKRYLREAETIHAQMRSIYSTLQRGTTTKTLRDGSKVEVKLSEDTRGKLRALDTRLAKRLQELRAMFRGDPEYQTKISKVLGRATTDPRPLAQRPFRRPEAAVGALLEQLETERSRLVGTVADKKALNVEAEEIESQLTAMESGSQLRVGDQAGVNPQRAVPRLRLERRLAQINALLDAEERATTAKQEAEKPTAVQRTLFPSDANVVRAKATAEKASPNERALKLLDDVLDMAADRRTGISAKDAQMLRDARDIIERQPESEKGSTIARRVIAEFGDVDPSVMRSRLDRARLGISTERKGAFGKTVGANVAVPGTDANLRSSLDAVAEQVAAAKSVQRDDTAQGVLFPKEQEKLVTQRANTRTFLQLVRIMAAKVAREKDSAKEKLAKAKELFAKADADKNKSVDRKKEIEAAVRRLAIAKNDKAVEALNAIIKREFDEFNAQAARDAKIVNDARQSLAVLTVARKDLDSLTQQRDALLKKRNELVERIESLETQKKSQSNFLGAPLSDAQVPLALATRYKSYTGRELAEAVAEGKEAWRTVNAQLQRAKRELVLLNSRDLSSVAYNLKQTQRIIDSVVDPGVTDATLVSWARANSDKRASMLARNDAALDKLNEEVRKLYYAAPSTDKLAKREAAQAEKRERVAAAAETTRKQVDEQSLMERLAALPGARRVNEALYTRSAATYKDAEGFEYRPTKKVVDPISKKTTAPQERVKQELADTEQRLERRRKGLPELEKISKLPSVGWAAPNVSVPATAKEVAAINAARKSAAKDPNDKRRPHVDSPVVYVTYPIKDSKGNVAQQSVEVPVSAARVKTHAANGRPLYIQLYNLRDSHPALSKLIAAQINAGNVRSAGALDGAIPLSKVSTAGKTEFRNAAMLAYMMDEKVGDPGTAPLQGMRKLRTGLLETAKQSGPVDTNFRVGSKGGGVDPALAKERVASIKGKLPEGVSLTYYADSGALPADVLANAKERGIDSDTIRGGVTADGRVFIVGSTHADMLDLDRTIAHELHGHYGFEGFVGESGMNKLLASAEKSDGGVLGLADKLGVGDQARAAAQGIKMAGGDERAQKMQALKEVIAYTEEATVDKSMLGKAQQFIKEMIGAARAALKRMGLVDASKLSTSDLFYLMRQSRKNFDAGKPLAKVNDDGTVSFRVGYATKPVAAAGYEQLAADTRGVVAENQSSYERLRESAFSSLMLAARQKTVDGRAGIEEVVNRALKGGVVSDKLAGDVMYAVRTADYRSNWIAAAVSSGAPQFVKDPKTDEVRIEINAGASLQNMFKVLNREVGKMGNEQFVGDAFTAYMAAERDLNDLGGDKLASVDDATKKRLVEAGRKNETFQEARRIYKEYNQNLLKFAAASGALSQKTVDGWLANDYVPFYRERNGVVELLVGSEAPTRIGNLNEQPYLHALVGDDTKIKDIFTSSLRNTSILMDMALRNTAARNTAFGFQEMGILAGAVNPDTGKVRGIREGAGPASKDTIRFKLDGKDHHAVVDTTMSNELFGDIPSSLLVQSLEGVSVQLPDFMRMLGVPSTWVRTMVTRDPRYAVRQIMRDSMSAWITAGGDAKPMIGTLSELSSMLQGKNAVEDFLKRSGVIGGQVLQGTSEDMAKIARMIAAGGNSNKLNTLFAGMDVLAMKGDAATRVSLYNSYIRQGMSERQALLAVMDSTNFTKRGTSPFMYTLNTLIPFFNAQIVGLDVLYRALRGKASGAEKLRIKNKLRMRGAMMAAMTMAYASGMEEDEAYENATAQQRFGNWFVRIPGMSEPLRVPIPFEVGLLFKALPEAMVHASGKDDKSAQAWDGWTDLAKQSIPGWSSMFLPQAIKPLIELGFNESAYSGIPIVGRKLEGRDKAEQFDERTPEVLKWAGQYSAAVGLSPKQLEHLVNGYTTMLGLSLLRLPDLMMQGDGPSKPEMRVSELPVIGGLFQPNDAGGVLQLAFQQAEDAARAKQTFKTLMLNGETEKAERFVNEYSDRLAMSSVGGRLQQAVGKINALELAVRADPKMSPKEKRDELAQLRQLELLLARQATGLRREIGRQ